MITSLPTTKTEVKDFNPSFIILYGKPKQGKSTIMASLESNLIIDLENGYKGLSGLIVNPEKSSEIIKVQELIKSEIKKTGKKPYRFITIDNATRLEEYSVPFAGYLYQQTPMGKNWDLNKDIRNLPNGSGYMYIRQALEKLILPFKNLCETLILVGHAKSTQINKRGETIDEMSFDLVGKSSQIIQGMADAVGYIYRDKEIKEEKDENGKDISVTYDTTYISFEAENNTINESRCPHLRGRKIPVIVTKDGVTTINTSQLFITTTDTKEINNNNKEVQF